MHLSNQQHLTQGSQEEEKSLLEQAMQNRDFSAKGSLDSISATPLLEFVVQSTFQLLSSLVSKSHEVMTNLISAWH